MLSIRNYLAAFFFIANLKARGGLSRWEERGKGGEKIFRMLVTGVFGALHGGVKQGLEVGRRLRVGLAGGPGGKALVAGGEVGAGFDFVADGVVREDGQGVPDAGGDVDSQAGSRAEEMAAGDRSIVMEDEEGDPTFEHQEGFGLGGIKVPVGGDVSAAEHDVQKAMGIVGKCRMEVVIHPPPRRLARLIKNALEQFGSD